MDMECRAGLATAFDRDRAAHGFHDLPGNGEAKAAAAETPRRPAFALLEFKKNARLVGGRNPDPGVVHRNQHFIDHCSKWKRLGFKCEPAGFDSGKIEDPFD